ncbi:MULTISPECIES: ABC transporter permease [Olivibacter]|uniref:ABC transporter permease n=1 Tax=Olivibacter jilunii TaxID=985016 RepID=A0ABW6B192_9SPHI|nr:ABC transporter permease [Olivibacter sp. UJ_SKK_5.1]MDX3912085.1 ABC transporter permease [Pseudosphingobacterium sp.]
MFQTYIKIAWRNIKKYRKYSLLHLLGLSLGVSTCLFLYLYIDFHRSFDHFHPDGGRTFRFVHELHLETTEYNQGGSYAIYQALLAEIPEVEKAAFELGNQEFTLKINDQLYKTDRKIALTNSAWFDIFDFHWLAGTPKALDAPNTAVLTNQMAKKYFGDIDPLGQTILIESKHPFTVVGVIDDSRGNTSVNADMYLSFASIKTLQPDLMDNFFTYWAYFSSNNNVYLTLHDAAQKNIVEKKLMQLAKKNLDPSIVDAFVYKLLPLYDSHFDNRYGGTASHRLLTILTIIGSCIMLIAGINYVNLTIAQQARRSMEVGTRKVLGSSKWQLFVQFMTESVLISSVALLIGLTGLKWLLPLANEYLLSSEPIQVVSWTRLWLFSGCLWLIVTLGAGVYPAYIMGRLQLHDALKNRFSLQNGLGRQSLVILQSAIAQIMIMITVVIVLQVNYLRNTDIGFNRESVMMVSLPKEAKNKTNVLNKLLTADPRVVHHSFCFQGPANDQRWGGTVLFDNRADWESWAVRYAYADTAYCHTFGLQLVAGRNLQANTPSHEYLVNELMVSMLGYDNPQEVLGKPLLAGGMHDDAAGIIVGVVKNYNTNYLTEPINPTVIGSKPAMYSSLAVKFSQKNITGLIADLQKEWRTLFPNALFDFTFLDDQIEALYTKEIQQQRLIWIASAIAITISSLGLLGMVALMILHRTKEVGVRKVFGASIKDIVYMLSFNFIRIVGIAFVIAAPISWWVIKKWLADFAYRIDLQWWMFALGGCVAFIIAISTVASQAIKAALANPVDSLRNE